MSDDVAAGRGHAPSRHRAPGRWAALAGSTTVLVLASLVADGIAFGAKEACRAGAWNYGIAQYQAHCYTDIYPLYFAEGLSAGKVPYTGHPVEYPVVIGAVMEGVASAVHWISNPFARGLQFFDVTVAVLALFLVAGVLATAYCAGPSRRWTALLVAFSPALILSAFINWDLIAMGLMMMGLAAWAARRPVLAGVLLGLAVATKFYPVVVLWPLLLLCLRAGRLRAFAMTAASAIAAWLVVNVPVAIVAPRGWATFYTFSSSRSVGAAAGARSGFSFSTCTGQSSAPRPRASSTWCQAACSRPRAWPSGCWPWPRRDDRGWRSWSS